MVSSIPTPPITQSPTAEERPLRFGDRYLANRLVKRHGTIETYFGTDTHTGAQVVIKASATQNVSSGAVMRLRHEADVMRQIKDGPLSRLLAVGEQDDLLFLVMPYVEGITLETRLRQGPLSLAETLQVGIALLTALCHAHEHGILHRDIKPANVIVNEGPTVTQGTLIDFGLARSSQLEVAIRNEFVGTARYMAPEQAGLLDRDIDEAADLYSVGIVLFECLAGRPPFLGETVGEVLCQHLTARVPELRSLDVHVPRVIDEAIQRLTRKDPTDRYQTATGALTDLRLVRDALARNEAEPAIVIGLHDARDTLTEPAFVGRTEELRRLELHTEAARQGEGGMVLVSAESGFGKTQLLNELTQRMPQAAALVVRGHYLEGAGHKPLQALEGVSNNLLAEGHLDAELLDRIRHELAPTPEIIGALLPTLARKLGLETGDREGPEAWGENRALSALTTFLNSLGTAARPALVILDDCQWADELSLKLLEHWTSERQATAQPCHVLLLVAYRSEFVDGNHRLRQMQPLDTITLQPFTVEETRKLATSMAGTLPEEVLQLLDRFSEGSPFMISAVLRGLEESGALLRDGDGWRIEPESLRDVQSSRHAAAFLASRLDRFPASTLAFLTAGAVIGREFPLALAASLADQQLPEAFAAFREARQRHILWSRADEADCIFVHDRLRLALVARLSSEQIQGMHRRAAEELEAAESDSYFNLAFHFDAAGESVRALPYALQAAARARAQHSLEIAAQQYAIARRGVAATDRETRYQIASGEGDILMLQGRYQAAQDAFQEAATLTRDPVQEADIVGRLGELAHKQGDMTAAGICIERALRLLGERVPRGKLGLGWCLLCELIVQASHSLLPRLLVARRPIPTTRSEFIAIQLLRRLSYAYWFSRGTLPTLWAHLRGMNLAERYPSTLELAHAYAAHGPGMSMLPWFRRGHAYAEKSLEIREQHADTWGKAQSLSFQGVVLYAESRYSECIRNCREAIRLFERTGDYWEMTTARYEIALSLYRLGDLRGAVEEAQRTREIGRAHGDRQAAAMPLDVLVLASRGRISAEIVHAELASDRNDPQTSAQVLLAEGVRLLYAGELAAAAESIQAAQRVVAQAGLRHAWVAAITPWLATVRRQQVEATSPRAPQARRRYLQQACRVARRARWVARFFGNELPHALRESGLLAAICGNPRQARKYLDRSLAVARSQQARHEEGQTLLARGELGEQLGWEGAGDDLRLANRILLEVDPRDHLDSDLANAKETTLSLVDRFDTVLESGREIAGALTRDLIFAEVCSAGMRLLRGETCLVVELEKPGELDRYHVFEGAGNEIISRRTMRHAQETGYPVSTGEELEADASESVLLSGMRSTLCAPILVRQQVEAFIYVTHREVMGLFGEDEERLAAFIATIAGAALENAFGFAKLEQLVAERTADLEKQSQELARSNEELEQFAYIASHDLQEPLRTVAGYCQLLQRLYKGKLDDEADEFISTIVEGAARMQTLIRDLLEFSRVGRRGNLSGETRLSEVLDDAVSDLRAAIEESGAVVTHDALPVVRGDPSQLRRLVQNLLANAIKFRGEQPPRIHVGVRQEEHEWIISVQDNGIGIAPNHCERIFKVFTRLHGKDEYPGTGIGLAVCKKTVDRHGGRIWTESEPGQGSTFFFSLPR